MIDKSSITEKLDKAQNVAQKYSLDVLEKDFQNLKVLSDEYKITMLFIGGFSAGKSALLNCVIGNERLVENQAPETAIAAELIYDNKDCVYAVSKEGKHIENIDLDNINVDDYSHLVYKLPSENLKQLRDYVLVDTPGFDSGIERHNKALMQYVGEKGTAFIFVVDCEKGTLSHSALNYLNEVSHYSSDIAVIINKCDKKTDEDIEKIKEHISKLVVAGCGRECPIITTSKYDEEVASKIGSLIKGFEPQELYEKNVGELVNNKFHELVKALKVIEKNKELDTDDIQLEIERREKAKNKLIQEMNKQKERMKSKVHREMKEKILNDINIKLMNSTHVLADSYKVSIESFQERVISIVRPIIIKSVENYETLAYEDIIKSINIADLDLGMDGEEVGNILNDILVKMSSISEILEKEKGKKDGKDSYKLITSLVAIATDIVAPPVEILIVFLPDIIGLVKSFMGDSQEQKLVEAIQQRIIPEIVEKLSDELDNSLNEVESVLIENIERSVSEMLSSETDALEHAKKQKQERENDFEKFILELKSDIEIFEKF